MLDRLIPIAAAVAVGLASIVFVVAFVAPFVAGLLDPRPKPKP